ncbi:methyltransferase domain-containing protein [Kaustia mangrovi]|uniref:Methyltransferase domain-containing protein n=1 Tax=Kaustia mangrovi TaxID=2593653 RepID=A0A7S8C1A7_9HYPH|nr:methyltransferase domain-containing protein [Kaustia mangrovi]QPC41553.1 methyltransferase domain-containing protein [Kaustia mangrovi]
MTHTLSSRLQAIVEALPLRPGLRVLEIGCGPGAMARVMAAGIGDGHVLAIDRSARAIAQAETGSRAELESGRLSFRQVDVEAFELRDGDAPFDIAIAVRVGALDGRHPKSGEAARRRIAAALTPGGRLFIDGGNPLREIDLSAYRQ